MSKTPKMTKVHFEAIAKMLRDNRPGTNSLAWVDAGGEGRVVWNAIANAAFHLCAASNPNFDKSKFLDAAGCND